MVDPEQVADIVATLREIEFPYTEDVNERRKQEAFKKRVETLIQSFDEISPPESKRDSDRTEVRLVSAEDTETIKTAQARVDTLKEAFDSYRGSLSEGTKAKVEKWQRELYDLRGVLGEKDGVEIDDLYEMMSDYVRSVNAASEARRGIDRQKQAGVQRQQTESSEGRLRTTAQAKPQSAWGKFKSFLGGK